MGVPKNRVSRGCGKGNLGFGGSRKNRGLWVHGRGDTPAAWSIMFIFG